MGEGFDVAMSCDVGHRGGSDLAMLWLWPAAAAPIGPLAWESPYALDVALKKKKIFFKCIGGVQDPLPPNMVP